MIQIALPTTSLSIAEINQSNKSHLVLANALYADAQALALLNAHLQRVTSLVELRFVSPERFLSDLETFYDGKVSAKQRKAAQRPRPSAFNRFIEPIVAKNPSVTVSQLKKTLRNPSYHGLVEITRDAVIFTPIGTDGVPLMPTHISNKGLEGRLRRLKSKIHND